MVNVILSAAIIKTVMAKGVYRNTLKFNNGSRLAEFFYTACYNVGAPGHSWQVAACAGHSIGRKGMIYASKVMATAALKMYQNPEIVKRAKEEFDRTLKGKTYICPIPDDVPNPQ